MGKSAPIPEAALAGEMTSPRFFSEEQWRRLARRAGHEGQAPADLREVAVSIRTLERLFQKQFQSAPCVTLPRWRAEEPRDVIRSTGASNKAVVRLLGYYDESHLARD